MSRRMLVAVSALLMLLVAPDTVRADTGCGKGGWNHDGPYWQLFDADAQVTVTGEVQALFHTPPLRGMGQGVHMKLASEAGVVVVHLGPAWYVDNQEPRLKVKDRVEVVGSRVTLDGKSAILASEVRHNGQTLKLRDAQGHPLWCGWRNR